MIFFQSEKWAIDGAGGTAFNPAHIETVDYLEIHGGAFAVVTFASGAKTIFEMHPELFLEAISAELKQLEIKKSDIV